MSLKPESRVSPRQRLTRGLTYSALGPVDVTRGVAGLTANSARSGAALLRKRYQDGELGQQLGIAQEQITKELAAAPEHLAKELAAAQEVVSALPHALQDARQAQYRRRRPWLKIVLLTAAVAGGVVVFSKARGSSDPQPQQPAQRPGGDGQPTR